MTDPFKGVINCDACGSMNDVSWTTCCECGVTPLVDAEGAAFDRACRPAQPKPAAAQLPRINTEWQHTNGARYTVRSYTNQCSTNPKYPLTIVYEGNGGRMWSRPADDWHRSMTAVKS